MSRVIVGKNDSMFRIRAKRIAEIDVEERLQSNMKEMLSDIASGAIEFAGLLEVYAARALRARKFFFGKPRLRRGEEPAPYMEYMDIPEVRDLVKHARQRIEYYKNTCRDLDNAISNDSVVEMDLDQYTAILNMEFNI